jgi:predicted RNA binding protein YcfA (HicA-like mRNA interferase family)
MNPFYLQLRTNFTYWIFSTKCSIILYMTKSEKILNKMKANPKDWRIDQLETIAKQYGVAIRKTGGSHVVFDHNDWIELLCVPAHRPIKPV